MALFAIVAFSDPGFLPLPPLAKAAPAPAAAATTCGSNNAPRAATRAGDIDVLSSDTADGDKGDEEEEGSRPLSASYSAASDDDEESASSLSEEDDAEVKGYLSPSRGRHRMQALTMVDPLLGRADEEAAERLPGVRAWLRRQHCAVCGLDRLPIR